MSTPAGRRGSDLVEANGESLTVGNLGRNRPLLNWLTRDRRGHAMPDRLLRAVTRERRGTGSMAGRKAGGWPGFKVGPRRPEAPFFAPWGGGWTTFPWRVSGFLW